MIAPALLAVALLVLASVLLSPLQDQASESRSLLNPGGQAQVGLAMGAAPEGLDVDELLALATGLSVDAPTAKLLAKQLDGRLADLPSEYEQDARTLLEALAKARWHQERALLALTPAERAVLAQAGVEASANPALNALLQKVDFEELTAGLAVLAQAALSFRPLETDPPVPLLADALGPAFGGAPAPARHRWTSQHVASTIAMVAGPFDETTLRDVEAQLQALPSPALDAVGDMVEGLRLATRPDAEAGPEIAAIADRIDRSRLTLEVLSLLLKVRALEDTRTHVPLPALEPDSPTPSLPMQPRPVALPPAPPLGVALAHAAVPLGLDAPSIGPLYSLPNAQQRALAQFFEQAGAYQRALVGAAMTPAPTAPGDLAETLGLLYEGEWAEGDPRIDSLMTAAAYIEAQHRLLLKQADFLLAVEELIPAFSAASESETTPVPCPLDPIVIAPLLNLDACGVISTWSSPALLTLDLGGDDLHLQRAGAPFAATSPLTAQREIGVPLSVVLDLGGNDRYQPLEQDCSLAAVCSESAEINGIDGIQHAWRLQPMAILIDWDGEGASATNVFESGERSQGYAGDTLPVGPLAPPVAQSYYRPYGVLVERVGEFSTLHSQYSAGNRSQGSAVGEPSSAQRTGAVAVLQRLVGSGSTAMATFVAGNASQGAHSGGVLQRGAVLAALVNIAGQDATHEDTYFAGSGAQGASLDIGSTSNATALALLADWVGPGTKSNDTYAGTDKARGWTPAAPLGTTQVNSLTRTAGTPLNEVFALFMDAAVSDGLHPRLATGANMTLVEGGLGGGRVAASDDEYGPLKAGNGFGAGLFIDISGKDSYPEGGLAANEATWQDPKRDDPGNTFAFHPLSPPKNGVDADAFADGDADGMPAAVESAWKSFVSLWDASDDDPSAQVLPATPAFLIDLNGSRPFMNGPHGFVLSAVGDTVYGPTFTASIHLDLAGNDRYLGTSAAATLLPAGSVNATVTPLLPPAVSDAANGDPATGPAPAQESLLESLLDAVQDSIEGSPAETVPRDVVETVDPLVKNLPLPTPAGGLVNDTWAEVAGLLEETSVPDTPSRPPPPASALESPPDTPPQTTAGPRALAFLLDLAGDDTYESVVKGAQGYGQGHALGFLADLSGSDLYAAPAGAQGVGIDGGIGILADLGLEGSNAFFAASPSQGTGTGLGGLGLLVAQGEHNQLEDGGIAGESARQEDAAWPVGAGASVNAQSAGNGAPTVLGTTSPEPASLEAGALYRFEANITDPDGDRLQACWTFQTGRGLETRCVTVQPEAAGQPTTASIDYAWVSVPTDALQPSKADRLPFQVRLKVQDAGGKAVEVALGSFTVANPPPGFQGPVRGPRTVVLPEDDPVTTGTYQPWFNATEWADGPSFRVDWGDGSPVVPTEPVTTDWLALPQAGSVHQSVFSDGRPLSDCLVSEGGDGREALDGDDATFLQLRTGGMTALHSECPQVHLLADLESARFVDTVVVAATIGGSSTPIRLSVEALLGNGQILPIDTIEVSKALIGPNVLPQRFILSLPEPQDIVGLQLRQISPTKQFREFVHVHSLEALGPGLPHQWTLPGDFAVRLTAIDGNDGTNTAFFQVHVAATGLGPMPVEFVDVAGRGPVQHASLATETPYLLTLFGLGTDPAGQACVDWGDGSAQACLSPVHGKYLRFRHSWLGAGDHEVHLRYLRNGQELAERDLVTIHVGDGLDLMLDAADLDGETHRASSFVSDAEPNALGVLFVDRVGGATWYSGAPYLAVADLGGDDRVTGQVAASMPRAGLAAFATGNPDQTDPTAVNLGALPALHVDASGNDDYLSTFEGAQAFATAAGLALLADLDGDDLYIAPGAAQGSTANLGVAALIDLAGTDWFNPVPVIEDVVGRGLPSEAEPWATRPSSLMPPRGPSSGGRPSSVQGSGTEGLGVLFLGDGHRLLSAGASSQGYGGHLENSTLAYVVADPSTDCTEFISDGFPPEPSLPEPDASDPTSAFDSKPLCALGLRDWREGGAGGTPIPVPLPQDSTLFFDFLANRGRYGAGMGALLSAGSLILQGGDGQGGSGPQARGLLASPGGGLVAVADARAQAYGENGQSGLFSSGATLLRLRALGQGLSTTPDTSPEPVGAGAAVLAVPVTSDLACDGSCGSPMDPALPVLPGGPALSWNSAPPTILSSAIRTLFVNLEPGSALPSPSSIEIVATGLVAPWGAGGVCATAGAVLAPPTVLARAFAPASATVAAIPLDLAMELADGPALPAGCIQVRVLARQVAGHAATAWTMLSADMLAIPPPAVKPIESLVFASTTPVPFHVSILQPMAELEAPSVTFAILPDGQAPSESTMGTPITSWSPAQTSTGVVGTANWMPVGADGLYRLWTRASWQVPGSLISPWIVTGAAFFIDRDAAAAPEIQLPSNVWRLGRPLPVTGTATDLQGIAGIQVRLLEGTSGTTVVRLVGDDGQGVLDASLDHVDGLEASWHATVVPVGSFLGGAARLQARATDTTGDTQDWVDAATRPLTFDGAPPQRLAMGLANHAQGTNQSFPITFHATLSDPARMSCTTSCAGAGLDNSSVAAVILRNGVVEALSLLGSTTTGDATTYVLEWNRSEGEPAVGEYNLRIQIADKVGNVNVTETGINLFVDRTKPIVQAVLVEPQRPIRPGDLLNISVVAADSQGPTAGRSGIGLVRANLLGQTVELTKDGDAYHGQLVVPNATSEDHRQLGPVDTITLNVSVTDRALNTQPATVALTYHRWNFNITTLNVGLRSNQVDVNYTTNRLVTIALAAIEGPEGVLQARAISPTNVTFDGLQPSTSYTFRVVLKDSAGWVRELVQTIATPVANDGRLELDPLPDRVHSGVVSITGNVTSLQPSHFRITLLNATSVPVAPAIEFDGSGRQPFRLDWDSRPLEGTKTVIVRMDDGDRPAFQSLQVALDNTGPDISLAVIPLGTTGEAGWFRGPVRLIAQATDDTNPVTLRIRGETRSSVLIDTDGRYELPVNALDGAFPRNPSSRDVQILIDTTAPKVGLQVATPDKDLPLFFPVVRSCADNNASCLAHKVTLAPSADEQLSGVAWFRLVVAGDEGPWSRTPPMEALLNKTLPDGELLLGLQVLDTAGNAGSAVVSTLLDTAGPRILASSWVGYDATGKPILHVVGQDILNGTADQRPAGVQAARFLTENTTTWSSWQAFEGNAALAVPIVLPAGKTLFMQLRDLAGNVGLAEPVPAIDIPLFPFGAVKQGLPTATLLDRPSVAPAMGDDRTPFAFSTVAFPWQGTLPTSVWANVAGVRHDLTPSGPARADGGRLYTVTIELEPTRVNSPHTFVISALYGGIEVSTPVLDGPLVSRHLPIEGLGVSAESEHGLAGLTWPALMAATAMAAVFLRRRRDAA